MKLIASVHKAKEGGYWAEIPALSGCFTQGETLSELRENIIDALETLFSLSKAEELKLRCHKKWVFDFEINFRPGTDTTLLGKRVDTKKNPRKSSQTRKPANK